MHLMSLNLLPFFLVCGLVMEYNGATISVQSVSVYSGIARCVYNTVLLGYMHVFVCMFTVYFPVHLNSSAWNSRMLFICLLCMQTLHH